MRTLEFKVEQQMLRKQPGCDFSNIVAKTVNYLKAKFHFSEEWNDCKKVAVFWLNEQEHPVLLDENNECNIPSDVLVGGAFYISVIGAKPDGYRLVTSKYKVRQEVY